MTHKIQTKDIPDQAMLDLVDRLWNVPGIYPIDGTIKVTYSNGALFSDICKIWYMVPPKVIRSKLEKLIDSKQLQGCACGCAGDFKVNHEGEVPVELYWEEAEQRFKSRRIIKDGHKSTGH